ncbi:MAG: lysylphosphatidylglycerol synthase transmembrane domain-containing protein [Planctomycetaceae bacterium]
MPWWLSLGLRLSATAALLGWALRKVEWSRMLELVRDADWRWLAAALALGIVVQIVAGLRWAALARPLGFDMPPGYFVWRFFEGAFFSLCLPSSIGGDVVKAYRVGDTTQRRLLAGCSVLADRLTGVAALGVLAGAAIAAGEWRLSLPATLAVAGGLLLAALTGFWLVVGSLDRIMSLIPAPHPARSFIAQLLPYQQRPSLIARAVGWSFVVQIGGSIAVALVGRTLRVDPGLGAWFSVAPLVALIETVPISIGGFGVRENAMEYLLGRHGVPGEQAVAVALLCGLTRILSGLVGGALFLLDRRAAVPDAAVTAG